MEKFYSYNDTKNGRLKNPFGMSILLFGFFWDIHILMCSEYPLLFQSGNEKRLLESILNNFSQLCYNIQSRNRFDCEDERTCYTRRKNEILHVFTVYETK